MTGLNGRRRAVETFEHRHGRPPTIVVRAPGRVNLIGEHTDYNDGFVLPMAIPHSTWIALEPRSDRIVDVESEGYGAVRIDTANLDRDARDWSSYLQAIAWVLQDRDGVDDGIEGWTGVITTDVPAGASLSSSASIELASLLAFAAVRGQSWDPVDYARLAQRAENEWVGMPCGIMDQLISATATANNAKLIDCRSLEFTDHPLPDGIEIMVMDTTSRRQLVDSAYRERRLSCERVAQAAEVAALRDLDRAGLDALDITPSDRRRAAHVIAENERTVAAAQAMGDHDVETLGRLMSASHVSLRDDYEVSGPELDHIVDAANDSNGCRGARMTGAGFAGCAVALVDAARGDAFVDEVTRRYTERTGLVPVIHRCQAADGAEIVQSA